MTRRLGRFTIGHDLIEKYPTEITKLMEGMLVVRAESLYAYGSIEYVAQSFRFQSVEQGMMVPEYFFTFHMGPFGPISATIAHENGKYSFERKLIT